MAYPLEELIVLDLSKMDTFDQLLSLTEIGNKIQQKAFEDIENKIAFLARMNPHE